MATAASCFHIPCLFIGTQENNFCFQVGCDETDLQSDAFHKSTTSSVHWLRVKDNLFLSLDPEGGDQLIFDYLTKQERVRPDCKFIVQSFNESLDSPPHPPDRGRPVTLAAMVDQQFKVVSCGESCDIKVETMDKLPEIIDHDCCTLFYMKSCHGSDHFLFQSAVHKTHVLGFDQVPGEEDCTRKLVLRPWLGDVVDEGCIIGVPLCP